MDVGMDSNPRTDTRLGPEPVPSLLSVQAEDLRVVVPVNPNSPSANVAKAASEAVKDYGIRGRRRSGSSDLLSTPPSPGFDTSQATNQPGSNNSVILKHEQDFVPAVYDVNLICSPLSFSTSSVPEVPVTSENSPWPDRLSIWLFQRLGISSWLFASHWCLEIDGLYIELHRVPGFEWPWFRRAGFRLKNGRDWKSRQIGEKHLLGTTSYSAEDVRSKVENYKQYWGIRPEVVRGEGGIIVRDRGSVEYSLLFSNCQHFVLDLCRILEVKPQEKLLDIWISARVPRSLLYFIVQYVTCEWFRGIALMRMITLSNGITIPFPTWNFLTQGFLIYLAFGPLLDRGARLWQHPSRLGTFVSVEIDRHFHESLAKIRQESRGWKTFIAGINDECETAKWRNDILFGIAVSKFSAFLYNRGYSWGKVFVRLLICYKLMLTAARRRAYTKHVWYSAIPEAFAIGGYALYFISELIKIFR